MMFKQMAALKNGDVFCQDYRQSKRFLVVIENNKDEEFIVCILPFSDPPGDFEQHCFLYGELAATSIYSLDGDIDEFSALHDRFKHAVRFAEKIVETKLSIPVTETFPQTKTEAK